MYDIRPFAPLYEVNSGSGPGTLIASVTISASGTAASAALPGNTGGLNNFNQVQIANTTTAWAYVNFGRSTTEIPAATVAASYPVAPGGVVVVTVTDEVCAASVILGSSTGSVIFTRGAGT
jgi:hypothetical protein